MIGTGRSPSQKRDGIDSTSFPTPYCPAKNETQEFLEPKNTRGPAFIVQSACETNNGTCFIMLGIRSWVHSARGFSMDRRQFLTMFSAAAAATILKSSGLVVASNSEIVLSNLDLRFRPPSGWHKYVGNEFTDAFPEGEMVTNDSIDDRVTVVTLNPILGFTRVPEPILDFNPQILVFSGQLDPNETHDPLEINILADETLSESVDDFEVLISPRPRNRNEFDSTESRIAFHFKTTYGLDCTAVRHLEFLIHQNMLYGFMVTNESENDLLDVQETFLKSIHPVRNSWS